MLLEI